jgi:hypothetical protein
MLAEQSATRDKMPIAEVINVIDQNTVSAKPIAAPLGRIAG